ncbi:MAG: cob(I)yrinic acid a,c-diamide adenosyltransferase [Thermoproteota archaeon]
MGYVYLYTGTGAGKTTNGLGLALRSVGHHRKVVIIQFLKWRKDIGEYKVKDRLKPYYEIYQFGRPVWLGEKKKTAEFGGQSFDVEAFTEEDKELANKGLEFAKKILREEKPNLLVLDEINLVAHWGLVDIKNITDLLEDLPEETDVVLTGRYTPRRLIEKADFVNVIETIKAPKEFEITEGIQY